MVGTIGAVFVINVLVMLVMSVCGLRRKLYLRKLKKEHEQKMKERQDTMAKYRLQLATVEEKNEEQEG